MAFYPSPRASPNSIEQLVRMNDFDDRKSGEPEADAPSKTRLKHEALAAQQLGERLIDLNDDILATLDLPEKLADAIALARAIKSRGALRRQRQYIGRLMRDMDTADIESILHELDERQALSAKRLHIAEDWRERLLAEGDTALGELLDRYPQADRQQLRQLVRAARAERKADKPPKHFRALFKLLRELLDEG